MRRIGECQLRRFVEKAGTKRRFGSGSGFGTTATLGQNGLAGYCTVVGDGSPSGRQSSLGSKIRRWASQICAFGESFKAVALLLVKNIPGEDVALPLLDLKTTVARGDAARENIDWLRRQRTAIGRFLWLRFFADASSAGNGDEIQASRLKEPVAVGAATDERAERGGPEVEGGAEEDEEDGDSDERRKRGLHCCRKVESLAVIEIQVMGMPLSVFVAVATAVRSRLVVSLLQLKRKLSGRKVPFSPGRFSDPQKSRGGSWEQSGEYGRRSYDFRWRRSPRERFSCLVREPHVVAAKLFKDERDSLREEKEVLRNQHRNDVEALCWRLKYKRKSWRTASSKGTKNWKVLVRKRHDLGIYKGTF
ncbi:hypothetical protein MLD38_007287 [Melastoma candidum]|uniref:Uncharacterized protein n=1 Tax=Melastoma candidum TaxID=119954 RepID=A0ACB9RZ58_9MYRT|nr:hypothetical protein MLD38_007287 [Melastoma candidum]